MPGQVPLAVQLRDGALAWTPRAVGRLPARSRPRALLPRLLLVADAGAVRRRPRHLAWMLALAAVIGFEKNHPLGRRLRASSARILHSHEGRRLRERACRRAKDDQRARFLPSASNRHARLAKARSPSAEALGRRPERSPAAARSRRPLSRAQQQRTCALLVRRAGLPRPARKQQHPPPRLS